MTKHTEDAVLDLEQAIQAFEDLAYGINDKGKNHPAWVWTMRQHIDAVRQAYEQDLETGFLAIARTQLEAA
jgi:uncharacterized protein Yka (UPF0111/DUF47 family)